MLNASYEVMVSERCRAHPVVERSRSLQPPFNDDVVTSANFQFRFAITFRPCYSTLNRDLTQCIIILTVNLFPRRKCLLFFREKQSHLFPDMAITKIPILRNRLR